MPYEVVWSTDSSLIGRKRGVQRDFVPTVKPVYTYATRKSAVETPPSRTHRVGSESPKGKPNESHQRSTDAKIAISAGQDLKFDGSMCSLKGGIQRVSILVGNFIIEFPGFYGTRKISLVSALKIRGKDFQYS